MKIIAFQKKITVNKGLQLKYKLHPKLKHCSVQEYADRPNKSLHNAQDKYI